MLKHLWGGGSQIEWMRRWGSLMEKFRNGRRKREPCGNAGMKKGKEQCHGVTLSSCHTDTDCVVLVPSGRTASPLTWVQLAPYLSLCPQGLGCRSLHKDTKTCRCASLLHKMVFKICTCLPSCSQMLDITS